jgi:hypothetical protein
MFDSIYRKIAINIYDTNKYLIIVSNDINFLTLFFINLIKLKIFDSR